MDNFSAWRISIFTDSYIEECFDSRAVFLSVQANGGNQNTGEMDGLSRETLLGVSLSTRNGELRANVSRLTVTHPECTNTAKQSMTNN